MGTLSTCGSTSALLCAACSVTLHAGPRANFFSPGIAPRSPEVVLYISHAVGGVGVGRPTFGLKVGELRQGSNSGDPDGGDPMQHHEFVNWQMEAHANLHISDLRVQLGRKITYDLTHRAFGSPGNRSTLQLGVPSYRNLSATPALQKPLFAHMSTASTGVSPHDASNDLAGWREIANAAAALAPARFTSAQRQIALHQELGAQRLQPARGGAN